MLIPSLTSQQCGGHVLQTTSAPVSDHGVTDLCPAGDRTAWILPFTAGGFIHIALVGVLPEVCQEREPWQCLKQALCMVAGVLIMLTVTVAFEH